MTTKETPITPQLRDFLGELADLLVKHGVEICAIENTYAYSVSVDGVGFYQNSRYDTQSDTYEREASEANFHVGTSNLDGEWLRKLTADLPVKP
jgi:hypothetical protein